MIALINPPAAYSAQSVEFSSSIAVEINPSPAYPSISNDDRDGLISIAIDDENLTDCAEYAAGGLIGDINYGNSMDCADIKVSDDAADGLIAIAIDAGNSMDCAEDAAGGLIAAIDSRLSMNCTDK